MRTPGRRRAVDPAPGAHECSDDAGSEQDEAIEPAPDSPTSPPPAVHADPPADVAGAGEDAYDPTALAQMRATEDFPEDDIYFYDALMGGRWTLAHTGDVVDSTRAMARGGPAKRWCCEYGYPQMASFHHSVYSRDGAGVLAREWCTRAHWFFRLAPSHDFVYTSAMVAEYEEGVEFTEWMQLQPQGSTSFQRGLQIRSVFPRIGPV